MNLQAQGDPAGAGSGPGSTLEWTFHPLREEAWPKSALLGGIVAGVSLGVAYSFASALWGLFALGMLVLSLSPYFCPTHYLLDAHEVQIRHLGWVQRRPWRQFCRAELRRDGVFLGPLAQASRLDSFRGCFLRSFHHPEVIQRFALAHVEMATD